MPSVDLTENLRDTIRSLRKERKIRGDKLAIEIGKSPSYISQIENGKIKEIDFSLLNTILEKITLLPSEKYDEFVKNLIDDNLIHLTPDELEHEKWVHLFNYSKRKFPITDNLRTFIQDKLDELQCTPQNFVEIINENRTLDEADRNIEPNTLNAEVSDEGGGAYGVRSSIRFEFSADYIEKILSGDIQTITYINMQGILFNLYYSLGYSVEESINLSEKNLYDNQFYTIKERNKLIRESYERSKETNQEFTYYDLQPTDYDKQYVKINKDINSGFNFLRDKDIKYACDHLSEFSQNMHDDLGFIVAIMSAPLHKISENKKIDFWKEYASLVKKYIQESEKDEKPENNSSLPE